MMPAKKAAWVRYLVTWFGSGLAPVAPGTFGSLFALPFAWGLWIYAGEYGLMIAAVALFGAGIPLCQAYLKHFGGNDPSEVVIDEVAGMWLLMASCKFYFVLQDGDRVPPEALYLASIFSFVLFRYFDILKFWPISVFDKQVTGGLGIMLDDAVAALYPAAIYLFIARFIPILRIYIDQSMPDPLPPVFY